MKSKVLLQTTILLLLLLGIITFAFRVELAQAAGVIYIQADGSINPSTSLISTLDRVTYTLQGSINGCIEITRNNVVLDGAGNTLQGPATSDLGINL